MTEEITRYHVGTDSIVPVTQQYVDEMQAHMGAYYRHVMLIRAVASLKAVIDADKVKKLTECAREMGLLLGLPL